jgi:hypothetical protein
MTSVSELDPPFAFGTACRPELKLAQPWARYRGACNAVSACRLSSPL